LANFIVRLGVITTGGDTVNGEDAGEEFGEDCGEDCVDIVYWVMNTYLIEGILANRFCLDGGKGQKF
tara:strand:- start:64 stop:264 length:201 start_codon:yes stop_codon:yes gene_type:complete